MTTSKTIIVLSAAVTLLAGSPAFAQHRGGGGARGGANAAHAAPRAAAAPQRNVAPSQQGTPRAMAVARPAPAGGAVAVQRYNGYRTAVVAGQHGVVVGTAVPRAVAPHAVVVAPRPYYGVAHPYYYRPYYTFYRPYYSFHPHVSLGFGLWVGYPFAYPYFSGYYQPYYAPYAYPAPYPAYPPPYPAYPPAGSAYPPPGSAYPPAGSAYPQYPSTSGSVGVQPGPQQNLGGVSFDITPRTAEVFVDGSYVGTVDQFTPTTQPLGLTPGRHTIEIRANGYHTMTFDADIVSGQVIPYQGTLER